jgi:predicted  nucleic acid-binding Zn-ribbon protein
MSSYKNVGKSSRNLRICGECGIVYTSVSMTKYIDQCPLCNSKRYEVMSSKIDSEQENII